ncbi:FtsX-like permease family protein [Luteibacter jiangsuensis]|uniref:FtsX-like permease family protein n=1 Tax=Luteibacter jiangsuensis TaxID=637577 RepID=A0ABX0Q509_9GAMM|nr:ABC transporter permease [Luteibacter jiangsuensis]NID04722.1 FtsX-like permease family protein [Luteibacter jiangsuensis]
MLGYYLELALRHMRRNPMLTGLMALAIAVGIGASMTTLTVMHLLAGDPLPGRSQHLYYPQIDVSPESKGREPYDVLDYRTAVDLWSSRKADRQALIVNSPVKLEAPETTLPPLMLPMLSTTADFFPMFDVPFRYGRGWSADDDEARSRVAVISSDLNEKIFAGANSVGRTLRLRGKDVRIVGVLAPWRPSPLFYNVRGGRFSNGDTADFYSKPEDVITPLSSALEINDGNFQQFTCWSMPPTPGHLQNSPCVWVALWVQLDSAEKVTAYRRYLDDYAAQQQALGRIKLGNNNRMRSLMEWLDFNGVVPNDVKLQTLLAFAFLVICLCNVVGLLLAKFLRRGGEIGLRRALGATRRTVFAQYLVEAGVIGVVGGVGGLLLTLLGLALVRRQPVPYADFIHLDVSMFLTTFALSVGVSLLAGLLPALRASLVEPALQLKVI